VSQISVQGDPYLWRKPRVSIADAQRRSDTSSTDESNVNIAFKGKVAIVTGAASAIVRESDEPSYARDAS
jgi:hypothetical protein